MIRLLSFLIIALIGVAGGAIWQLTSIPSRQHITVGSYGDNRYVQGFHARERTLENRIPFRWSQPQGSSIWFWPQPSGHPTYISLHLYRPDETLLTLTTNNAQITFTLLSGPRIYHILLPSGSEPVHLTTTPIPAPVEDKRSLGIMLFSLTVTRMTPVQWSDVWQTFTLAPFFPLALLGMCVAIAMIGRLEYIVSVPITLAIIVLAGQTWPAWRLEIAWIAGWLSVVACISAGIYRLTHIRALSQSINDRSAIALLLCLGTLTLVLTYVPVVRSDGTGYYAYARSLVYRGDLVMDETFTDYPVYLRRTETGLLANPWSAGPAMIWFGPLALYRLVNGGDGHDQGAYAVVCLISAWAGIGTMLIAYRCARRWYTPAASLIGAIGGFYGSTLWYYSMREGGFAHAFSAFVCALAILTWLRLREQPSLRRWIAFGVAAGLVVLIYWATILLLIAPCLGILAWLFTVRRDYRHILAITGYCLLATLIGLLVFSPQMIVWNAIYSTPLAKPPGTPSLVLSEPHIIDLFTARMGLVRWTPLAMIGLASLFLVAWRNPLTGFSLIIAAFIYISYNGLLDAWDGGGSFGTRRLTSLALWYALGLAAVAELLLNHRYRLTLTTGLVAGSGWVFMLMIRHAVGDLPETGWAFLETLSLADLYLGPNAFPVHLLGDFLKTSFLWEVAMNISIPSTLKTIVYLTILSSVFLWVFWYFSARKMSDQNNVVDVHG
ncbi:MAG: ArnT family glycosyltransferase [Chloroflexus sp.]|uniref:ArnT family glycosyltransferase n=1 Tax=Chloroflexus sp. TaxID=1904827 RepID=UPI00404A973A